MAKIARRNGPRCKAWTPQLRRFISTYLGDDASAETRDKDRKSSVQRGPAFQMALPSTFMSLNFNTTSLPKLVMPRVHWHPRSPFLYFLIAFRRKVPLPIISSLRMQYGGLK
jgi:hypothetical protein